MYDITDIHTHILPGFDDGAQNMDASIAMADMAAESGVGAIVATPHSNQKGYYENYASPKFLEKVLEMRKEIKKHAIPIKIYSGMEVYGTLDVPHLLKEKKLITINQSRYVLVEFGFRAPVMHIERILYRILDAGYVPIVAHPERYTELQREIEAVAEWMDSGVGIQLNKGSFFGKFGSGAYKMAHILTANGLVTCIASDAHGYDVRTPDMTDISEYVRYNFSGGLAELLLSDNPDRIVKDKPLLKVKNIQRF